jgi:hypothetical protein
VSGLKKLLKRSAPSPKKLTPKFVANSKLLSNGAHANLAFRAVYQNSSIAKAPDWGDTKAMRQNLRAEHELSTSPSSRTSDKIFRRDQLARSTNPDEIAERERLTAEINAATLNRGKIGIAIGGTVVGGAAGSAIKAGGTVAGRTGMEINRIPSAFPQNDTLLYDGYSNGTALNLAGQQQPKPGLISGFLSSVVGFLHAVLVPAKSGGYETRGAAGIRTNEWGRPSLNGSVPGMVYAGGVGGGVRSDGQRVY